MPASIFVKSSSILETIRFCSAIGGIGIVNVLIIEVLSLGWLVPFCICLIFQLPRMAYRTKAQRRED